MLLQGFIGKNAKIRIFRSVWLHSVSVVCWGGQRLVVVGRHVVVTDVASLRFGGGGGEEKKSHHKL